MKNIELGGEIVFDAYVLFGLYTFTAFLHGFLFLLELSFLSNEEYALIEEWFFFFQYVVLLGVCYSSTRANDLTFFIGILILLICLLIALPIGQFFWGTAYHSWIPSYGLYGLFDLACLALLSRKSLNLWTLMLVAYVALDLLFNLTTIIYLKLGHGYELINNNSYLILWLPVILFGLFSLRNRKSVFEYSNPVKLKLIFAFAVFFSFLLIAWIQINNELLKLTSYISLFMFSFILWKKSGDARDSKLQVQSISSDENPLPVLVSILNNIDMYEMAKQVVESVSGRLADPLLDVDSIASDMAMSKRNFHRRFREETGLPPAKFLSLYRLYQAKCLIEEGTPIKRVVYLTGYKSQSYFTTSFSKVFGYTPKQIKAGY